MTLRSRRLAPGVEERFYVARPVEGATFGIGTIIAPDGQVIPLVTDGSIVTWAFADDPVLEEGATVELVAADTKAAAETVSDEIRVERDRRKHDENVRVARECRETAAQIIGPYEPAFTHLNPSQRIAQVEALALVVYQARGHSKATELPA